MVAPIINGMLYRGSAGAGRFTLASGQRFEIRSNDKKVIREIKRRKLWLQIEPHVIQDRSFALKDSTRGGVDVFVWFGCRRDGGFTWFAFPGASQESPDVLEFLKFLAARLFASGSLGKGGGNGPAC